MEAWSALILDNILAHSQLFMNKLFVLIVSLFLQNFKFICSKMCHISFICYLLGLNYFFLSTNLGSNQDIKKDVYKIILWKCRQNEKNIKISNTKLFNAWTIFVYSHDRYKQWWRVASQMRPGWHGSRNTSCFVHLSMITEIGLWK